MIGAFLIRAAMAMLFVESIWAESAILPSCTGAVGECASNQACRKLSYRVWNGSEFEFNNVATCVTTGLKGCKESKSECEKGERCVPIPNYGLKTGFCVPSTQLPEQLKHETDSCNQSTCKEGFECKDFRSSNGAYVSMCLPKQSKDCESDGCCPEGMWCSFLKGEGKRCVNALSMGDADLLFNQLTQSRYRESCNACRKDSECAGELRCAVFRVRAWSGASFIYRSWRSCQKPGLKPCSERTGDCPTGFRCARYHNRDGSESGFCTATQDLPIGYGGSIGQCKPSECNGMLQCRQIRTLEGGYVPSCFPRKLKDCSTDKCCPVGMWCHFVRDSATSIPVRRCVNEVNLMERVMRHYQVYESKHRTICNACMTDDHCPDGRCIEGFCSNGVARGSQSGPTCWCAPVPNEKGAMCYEMTDPSVAKGPCSERPCKPTWKCVDDFSVGRTRCQRVLQIGHVRSAGYGTGQCIVSERVLEVPVPV